MPSKPTFQAFFAALAALVALAFAPPLAAQSVTGDYQLSRIDDTALPAVVETEGDCQEELVSATLTLAADNIWEIRGEIRETCGARIEVEEDAERGRFSVTGGQITFSNETIDPNDDPQEIEWEELGIGTLQGNVLTVVLEDGETALTFER